jgi:hypothetical protein
MRHLQVASNLWNHKLWLITHLRTEWTKWLLLRLARAGTLNAAEGPRFGLGAQRLRIRPNERSRRRNPDRHRALETRNSGRVAIVRTARQSDPSPPAARLGTAPSSRRGRPDY